MVGSHSSGRLNTYQVVTLPNGPICALDTIKSSKSMDSIISQLCGDLQPGGFSLIAIKDNPITRGHLTLLRKQPRQKQTDELLASIQTCTVCLIVKSVYRV